MLTPSARRRRYTSVRRRLLSSVLVAALMATLLPTWLAPVVTPTAEAVSTTIVISQVYGGGGNSGATYTHDFIELFNRGNTTVDISGWSVQYTSAGGSSWAVTNLCSSTTPNTCTIPAGGYYLVQQAQGAGGTTALPTPVNATGTTAMSGTNGKVALANSRTALTGTCPTSSAAVVDFVGFGGTTSTTGFCFEGAGPTPAPSNTTAVLRAANGCTDTDNNNTDFATGAPTPRNSATTPNPCGGADAAPTVSSTTPTNSENNVAVNANITVNFSEPVTVSGSSFTISCGTSGAHTFALTGSSASYTLNPDTDFANSETCTVTVVANQVSDQDSNDPPDNMAANHVFTFNTILAPGICGNAFTPTFVIQGSSTASPKNGENHNTEAVVIGDFQGETNLSGFYIQDPSGDGNTATSDGLFVFDGGTPAVNVSVGDRVRVSGTVSEAFNKTQITPTSPVQICSTGNSPPLPTVVDLPEPINNDLERYENMLTTFPETLTVTGNFGWGRFGELVLSSDGRLFQQNSFDRPNTPGALARANLNERRYVVLDDGKSIQNPDPIPYIGPGNTRRTGDTVTGLTGVLTFDFSEYRVQPTGAVTFAQANPRPSPTPAAVGGNLKVVSANVLNYFNGNGTGGGFPTARGATTAAEFARQRAKIISSLTTINADVLGIIEVENDGGGAQSALQDLVNGMNDATAPGTYVGLHSPNPGTDLIQNAIIYKPASVTPVGVQVNDVNAAWGQARAPLAQTFQHNGNAEKFTFIVNHFTSKGCSASDTGPDADQGDGQGCDNFTRSQQSQRLLVFIQDRKTASGDPDVLSMGDYNAYGEEDPLFILEQDSSDTLMDGAGGLHNQSKRFVPALERYSFQFDSQFGELDHAYATKSMNNQVSGTTIWHINADEPVIIDYNQEFKKPLDSDGSPDHYTPTPYRSADHDPLIVGLNLTSAPLPAPGTLIISEYRLRGPNGAQDEFVEFYNTTNSPITVPAQNTDGSAGWALAASDGAIRFLIPGGTVIPARGHFLAAGGSYSLSNYPGGYNGTTARNSDGDQILLPNLGTATSFPGDIPDASGIALFSSALPANFDTDHRLDAVGYSTNPALYREGAGFPAASLGAEAGSDIEYSFLRLMTTGPPQDTGVNTADFIGVSTNAATTTAGTYLGAPGPENLSSPILRLGVYVNRLDHAADVGAAPNRVRRACSNNAEECNPQRSALGTMSMRRRVINATGAPITRLRFRVRQVSTLTSPAVSGQADLRPITSGNITVTLTTGNQVPVQGTVIQEPPNQQTLGGGWNTTWAPTGTISLESPLAPNAYIDVQFLMGVQMTGNYFIFINVEALP